MIDVGIQNMPAPLPEENFVGLKRRLEDPASYFLGADFRAAIIPDSNGRSDYYNLPAAKDYVFRRPNSSSTGRKVLSPSYHSPAAG